MSYSNTLQWREWIHSFMLCVQGWLACERVSHFVSRGGILGLHACRCGCVGQIQTWQDCCCVPDSWAVLWSSAATMIGEHCQPAHSRGWWAFSLICWLCMNQSFTGGTSVGLVCEWNTGWYPGTLWKGVRCDTEWFSEFLPFFTQGRLYILHCSSFTVQEADHSFITMTLPSPILMPSWLITCPWNVTFDEYHSHISNLRNYVQ